jgi:hypothetical protein
MSNLDDDDGYGGGDDDTLLDFQEIQASKLWTAANHQQQTIHPFFWKLLLAAVYSAYTPQNLIC